MRHPSTQPILLTESPTVEVTVGEWIEALYETLMEEYGDPELAAVATHVLVQGRLLAQADAETASFARAAA